MIIQLLVREPPQPPLQLQCCYLQNTDVWTREVIDGDGDYDILFILLQLSRLGW